MTEATLTTNYNGSNRWQYLFKVIAPVTDAITQDVIDFPIVNQEQSGNIMFRFSGKSETTDFEFAIYDDGSDSSNGTALTYESGDFTGNTVNTINEQILWLKSYVFNPQFDTYWTLVMDRYHPAGVSGVITNLTFDNAPSGTNVVTGRMSFKTGIIVPLE